MRIYKIEVPESAEVTTVSVPYPCGIIAATPSQTVGVIDVWIAHDVDATPVRNLNLKTGEPNTDGYIDYPTGYQFLAISEMYKENELEEVVEVNRFVFHQLEPYTPPDDPMGLMGEMETEE